MKWKKCKNTATYYKMKCNGMRARFYPWFIANEELESCMNMLPNTMPIFKEIREACLKGFGMMRFAAVGSILMTILLILI